MKAERRGSLLPVVALILVALWGLFELAAANRERARRRKCISCLNNCISYACYLYAEDHEKRFPPTLGALFPCYIPDGRAFLCPRGGKAAALEDDPHFSRDTYTPAMLNDTYTDYVYVSGLMADDSPHYVLAFDDEWNHDGEGVHVTTVCVGPHAYCWTPDIKALHKQLARQEKELAAKGRKMKLLRPPWSSWPDPPAGWPRPWYARRSGRAVAVGAFVAFAAALALVVRKVRRGRTPSGS